MVTISGTLANEERINGCGAFSLSHQSTCECHCTDSTGTLSVSQC